MNKGEDDGKKIEKEVTNSEWGNKNQNEAKNPEWGKQNGIRQKNPEWGNIREAAPPTGEYVSLVHEVSRQQDHASRSPLLEKCPQVAPRVRIHSCGRLVHKNNL